MRRFLLAAVLAVPAAGLTSSPRLAAQSLTCDPAGIKPDSYRLTVEAQALNVTKPRYRWWDQYDIGKSSKDFADLNEVAIAIAERARELDDSNLLAHAQLARHYVIGAVDAKRAYEEWRRVLAAGGAITWTATLHDVDPLSYFVLAFDRAGIRVYRLGQLAGALRTRAGVPEFPGPDREELWRALGGCVPEAVAPEAVIPWSAVRQLEAGALVLSFDLDRRVAIASDRRKRRELDRLVVSLHGAAGGADYRYGPFIPYRRPIDYGGVAGTPPLFQERIRGTLVEIFDPEGRIKLPKQKLAFGW